MSGAHLRAALSPAAGTVDLSAVAAVGSPSLLIGVLATVDGKALVGSGFGGGKGKGALAGWAVGGVWSRVVKSVGAGGGGDGGGGEDKLARQQVVFLGALGWWGLVGFGFFLGGGL